MLGTLYAFKVFFCKHKLAEPVWPTEGHLRPPENWNDRNRVKSCEFRESGVIFDD